MNKNILMILYAKSVGGAELQFLELANYLSQSHRVRLVCLGGNGALKDSKVSERLEVRVYSYNSTISALINLLRAFLGNISFSTDSIVTTSFIGNVLGFSMGLFQKVRLVSLQTVSVCICHPIVDRFVLRKFDELIAGANDIKDYLIAHGQPSSKIQVVHNWVDFSKRASNKKTSDLKAQFGVQGKLVIGCIGRFHPQKGQVYLIKAFAKIIDIFPNTVLMLVGDGETKEKLEKAVRDFGLSENVIFTGTIIGDKYNDFLKAIDIYVQPSIFEGLPRTLLDAMYMGKSIVATNINGNCEAIKDEVNGLLVPSKDSNSLFLSISRLLNSQDEMKIFSREANITAVQNFSMEGQLKKISSIIF
jgi:glycosyltransferase involved in cell wall biosynthesis